MRFSITGRRTAALPAVVTAILFISFTSCSKTTGGSAEHPGHEQEGATTTPAVPSGAKAAEPCSLLTSADAKEVLGEEIINAENAPSDDPRFGRCTFDTSAFAGRVVLALSAEETEEAAQASVKGETGGAEPVTGIGDEAYQSAGGGEHHLDFREGLVVVRLALVTDDPGGTDKIKALALKILPRLNSP